MEVILDTNFIISCIRKRIDFIEELEKMGFKILLPLSVMQEMKDLKLTKRVSHEEKSAIEIAFQMFSQKKIKKTRIGNDGVDKGLIKKGKEGVYIATLDREIKRNVPNRIVISNARNGLEIERD